MPLGTNSRVSEIAGRGSDEDSLQVPADDISGGVVAEIGNVSAFTLYLHAEGAVTVTVEFSPDDSENWYEADESPIEFSEAGDSATNIAYKMTHVRVTGLNSTPVRAQLREVV
ncbi:hypothetical protein [Salarchaeum japonicum]|uniref:hypothetical protein n=1 Tax=Salarchaeum japonicum TaxID=555573 RepID=UPI003C72358A